MTKKSTGNLPNLLLGAVELAERLAFQMFAQDHPKASREEFDGSPDRSRYLGYANIAVTEIVSAA